MPRQSFFVTILQAAIGMIVIALAWELWARSKAAPHIYPAISDAFDALTPLMADPRFRTHVAATLGTFAQGFLPAAMIAIPIGLALRLHHLLRLILASPAMVLAAMPLAAVGPLIIIFQGLGPDSKITMAFWMSLAGILHGMMANRPTMMVAADQTTDTRIREWISAIAAGLRSGILFGVSGVVILEMIGSDTGLGSLAMLTSSRFEVAQMLASILLVLLPTVVAVVLLQALELHLAPRT